MGEITQTTRITPRGQTTVVVTPPHPCGLTGCVGELQVTVGSNLPTRVHLDDAQRNEIIEALGGVLPKTHNRHYVSVPSGPGEVRLVPPWPLLPAFGRSDEPHNFIDAVGLNGCGRVTDGGLTCGRIESDAVHAPDHPCPPWCGVDGPKCAGPQHNADSDAEPGSTGPSYGAGSGEGR